MIILLGGGSASGKSTLAQKITEQEPGGMILSQDSFYVCQSERLKTETLPLNFDVPAAIDFEALTRAVQQLKSGKPVQIPLYDFATSTRYGQRTLTAPSRYVIVEGTLVLAHSDLRALSDLSIYIKADQHLRYERRMARDLNQRGWSEADAKAYMIETLFPCHERYVRPTQEEADMICEAQTITSDPDLIIQSIFASK